MKDNNNVRLSGKLIDKLVLDHEVYGEKFYRTYCGCYRTSGYRDGVPVIISEKLLVGLPVTTGIAMEIEGQIRTHNRLKDGKSISNIYIFATDLKFIEKAANTNEVSLTGHVCRKADYRETSGERVVADFLLAVNRAYGKSDYIPVIVWGRNAKFARKIEVGQRFEVEGRFQSRIYTKKLPDGTLTQKVAYELSASKLTRMEDTENEI